MENYTEEEAGKKWCPINQTLDFCCGSECMWWVWTERKTEKKRLPDGGFVVVGAKGNCGGANFR